ncbi:MAG: hypothetical protein GY842_09180 [bacterium]|nr:hypothetical protein [bacterium]
MATLIGRVFFGGVILLGAGIGWAEELGDRLNASFVEGIRPGERGLVAVSWKGETVELTAWIDFDNDGLWSDDAEQIISGVDLAEGVEVFEFAVPEWAIVGTEAAVRFKVPELDMVEGRFEFPAPPMTTMPEMESAMESATAGCMWEGSFGMGGLAGMVTAITTFDDGSGVALYAGGYNYLAKWDGSQWSDISPSGAGVNGWVNELTTFDDGSGVALYVGGNFYVSLAGGGYASDIAKWDGTQWSELSGPSGSGVNNLVLALVTHDDGSGMALFVGGDFSTAGGVAANKIAKWDGSQWSEVSSGMSSRVQVLTTFDDGSGVALYAGGAFSTAGGVVVNNIAKWDGSQWSDLSGPSGTGTNSVVWALTSFDDGSGEALYAGGSFYFAGGVPVNRIAKWDGSQWSELYGPSGTGVNGTVAALTSFDDGSGEALYVGGGMTWAGGVTVNGLAKWDGSQWSGLPAGPSGGVYTFHVSTDGPDGSGRTLYAGGSFASAGEVGVNNIAKWDGSLWSGLNGPSAFGVNDRVDVLATHDDGSGEALYAGGTFTSAGRVAANRIARWDGYQWSDLSGPSASGADDWVLALASHDDGSSAADKPRGEDAALYAGGYFTSAGGVTVNGIAKWDGYMWSDLSGPSGTGVDGPGRVLATFDDGSGEALYAGGSFASAGGVTVNNIAKWHGSEWSDLSGPSGTGLGGRVVALATFDDGSGEALYAGGYFAWAGGVTVSGIAKWDGSQWSDLYGPSASGVDGSVWALVTHDDGSGEALYAGGSFTSAGGVTVNNIAKWDGSQWSDLSGPSGTGVGGSVVALATFDDGSGEALYAGGSLTSAGGVSVNFIAKWDGSQWLNPFGFGMNDTVLALTAFDDGQGEALFAGGTFTAAGDFLSSRIAKWSCDTPLFKDGFEGGDTSAWSNTLPESMIPWRMQQ